MRYMAMVTEYMGVKSIILPKFTSYISSSITVYDVFSIHQHPPDSPTIKVTLSAQTTSRVTTAAAYNTGQWNSVYPNGSWYCYHHPDEDRRYM